MPRVARITAAGYPKSYYSAR